MFSNSWNMLFVKVCEDNHVVGATECISKGITLLEESIFKVFHEVEYSTEQ